MEEIDLKEIFFMFWRKKLPIIAIVLIFIIIGCIYTIEFTKPIYSASTTVVLVSAKNKEDGNTTITTTDINVNAKLVSTYSQLIKSRNVLKEVISNLGIEINEGLLRENVSVNSVKGTELIKITVKHEDATDVARIANELTKVFADKVKEMYNINNIQILDEASTPVEPSNINHKKDVILFACIGAFVGICYVIVANLMDTTIKTAESVEKEFNLPVLTSIPIYGSNTKKSKRGGKK